MSRCVAVACGFSFNAAAVLAPAEALAEANAPHEPPVVAHAPESCLDFPHAIVADLGLHVVNAAYQQTLSCHVVLQVSAGLYVPWTVTTNVLGLAGEERPEDAEATDIAGGVVRVRSFLFPTGSAPTGFWISPFFQVGYVRAAALPESLHGIAQSSGVSLGGTFRIASHWLVALGAGAQFHVASFDGTVDQPGFALPGPTIDINTGYSF